MQHDPFDSCRLVQIEAGLRRHLDGAGFPRDACLTLVNVSENATFLVEDGDRRIVARVHRPDYTPTPAIRSELAWLDALAEGGVVDAPVALAGRDGLRVRLLAEDGALSSYRLVFFGHLPGSEPETGEGLADRFRDLGAITARLHAHARRWRRPAAFTRRTWDFRTMFGADPHWGRWDAAPDLDDAGRRLIARTLDMMEGRLARFGCALDRFGLIHGDLRLANLLADGRTLRVIDFDDCGFGWFLYDFGAAVSFFEDDPAVAELMAAWAEGYRTHGSLDAADAAELWTFVMARRIVLLAWLHSRGGTELSRTLGPTFTAGTLALCERYLVGIPVHA